MEKDTKSLKIKAGVVIVLTLILAGLTAMGKLDGNHLVQGLTAIMGGFFG